MGKQNNKETIKTEILNKQQIDYKSESDEESFEEDSSVEGIYLENENINEQKANSEIIKKIDSSDIKEEKSKATILENDFDQTDNINEVETPILRRKVTLRVKKKMSRKEKLKEIILNIYKNSLYYEILKASSIIDLDYLYYQSPFSQKNNLKSFIILTNFAIVILIKKEHFIQETNWYNIQETSDEKKDLQETKSEKPIKILPFIREYFIVPYLMIDDLENNLSEKYLKIYTKVNIIILVKLISGF